MLVNQVRVGAVVKVCYSPSEPFALLTILNHQPQAKHIGKFLKIFFLSLIPDVDEDIVVINFVLPNPTWGYGTHFFGHKPVITVFDTRLGNFAQTNFD